MNVIVLLFILTSNIAYQCLVYSISWEIFFFLRKTELSISAEVVLNNRLSAEKFSIGASVLMISLDYSCDWMMHVGLSSAQFSSCSVGCVRHPSAADEPRRPTPTGTHHFLWACWVTGPFVFTISLSRFKNQTSQPVLHLIYILKVFRY